MKVDWMKMDSDTPHPQTTWIAKVYGGWVLKCTQEEWNYKDDTASAVSTALCFIPDRTHIWPDLKETEL